jgi:hypothetical protein
LKTCRVSAIGPRALDRQHPSTMNIHDHNTQTKIGRRHRRQLEAAVDAQIREYAVCRKLLRYVDNEVFSAGIVLTGSASGLAAWLCEPARSLGGKVPLRVMRTGKGRKTVANILRALTDGIYL